MNQQLKKGLIEILILSELQKNSDNYGYILNKRISRFIEISESTLYPILRRLACQGDLSVHLAQENNRLRKYYAITEKGIERLHDLLNDLKTMKEIYKAHG